MLFFISIRSFFFYYLCFCIYNNVYPNNCESYKKRCESMKSITEHPKNSYKILKTIRQAEKAGFNSSLYSDITM